MSIKVKFRDDETIRRAADEFRASAALRGFDVPPIDVIYIAENHQVVEVRFDREGLWPAEQRNRPTRRLTSRSTTNPAVMNKYSILASCDYAFPSPSLAARPLTCVSIPGQPGSAGFDLSSPGVS